MSIHALTERVSAILKVNASDILRELGYRVLEAGTGAAALEILHDRGDQNDNNLLSLSRDDAGRCSTALRQLPG